MTEDEARWLKLCIKCPGLEEALAQVNRFNAKRVEAGFHVDMESIQRKTAMTLGERWCGLITKFWKDGYYNC